MKGEKNPMDSPRLLTLSQPHPLRVKGLWRDLLQGQGLQGQEGRLRARWPFLNRGTKLALSQISFAESRLSIFFLFPSGNKSSLCFFLEIPQSASERASWITSPPSQAPVSLPRLPPQVTEAQTSHGDQGDLRGGSEDSDLGRRCAPGAHGMGKREAQRPSPELPLPGPDSTCRRRTGLEAALRPRSRSVLGRSDVAGPPQGPLVGHRFRRLGRGSPWEANGSPPCHAWKSRPFPRRACPPSAPVPSFTRAPGPWPRRA